MRVLVGAVRSFSVECLISMRESSEPMSGPLVGLVCES